MEKMSEECFTSLYNENMLFVYRIAFSYLKNKEESENVMQETFMKLYSTPPKDLSTIKSWLATVAKNLSLNQLKRKNKEKSFLFSLAKEKQETEQQMSQSAQNSMLSLINDLPEKYAVVLRMFYLGELPIKTIAAQLNIRENTIKKRLERGRKILLELFEKEEKI